MFFRRMWDAMPTSRRARELKTATQRESTLKEEFARRVRGLESQILLLRAENRALLNSVLGIAGIPPIMVTDPAELPVIAQGPKQIPRTASRAPENREQSNSALDSAWDDSFQNNGSPKNGTASLQIDNVGNASGRVEAPNGTNLPSTAAGHSSAVPLRKPRGRGANDGRIVTPMRRRSWHQIYRMLELESTRRKANDQQGTT